VARRDIFGHIRPMAERTCKPDADLKRLWRMHLPGTPFPACGMSEDSSAAADDDIRSVGSSRDEAKPDGERNEPRR
jgi:hypothetical protein